MLRCLCRSGTGTYVVSIAMRHAPDGQSRCDWANELKFAITCEEAVTALLHSKEEPLEFLHDTCKLLPCCCA
jgi:hypothetical protein